MTYALATRLERAVKNSGLKYKKVSGWASRGHGTMGTIQTVVPHHTAGPKSGNSPSLNVVTNGRPGLSGPLAQIFLERDGTPVLVAAGIAYHAGVVRSNSYQNSHSIGIEAENTGLSNDSPWPKAQIEAYAKLCKALCKEFNLPTSRVLGHKEICSPAGRKSDPSFNMNDFRNKVGGAKGGVGSAIGSAGTGGASKPYAAVSYGTTLGKWDKGDPVKDWQDFLIAQGYKLKDGVDGYFGDDTVTATKSYQKSVSLKADGLVGDDTWAKAKKDGLKTTRKSKASAAPKFPLPSDEWYGPESSNKKNHSGYWEKDRAAIKLIQKALGITVDGLFGNDTYSAVKKFQKRAGIRVDGGVGSTTWKKLVK